MTPREFRLLKDVLAKMEETRKKAQAIFAAGGENRDWKRAEEWSWGVSWCEGVLGQLVRESEVINQSH